MGSALGQNKRDMISFFFNCSYFSLQKELKNLHSFQKNKKAQYRVTFILKTCNFVAKKNQLLIEIPIICNIIYQFICRQDFLQVLLANHKKFTPDPKPVTSVYQQKQCLSHLSISKNYIYERCRLLVLCPKDITSYFFKKDFSFGIQ